MSSTSVEVSLIYGGDLVLQANGDLQLSIDVFGTIVPQATFERILRIILTNPITIDANGNPVIRPDYLEHPYFGSGARSAIEENFTSALVDSINARIQNALSTYPYIVHQPPPTIDWQQVKPGEYTLVISGTAITGEPYILPAIPLSANGAVTIIGV